MLRTFRILPAKVSIRRISHALAHASYARLEEEEKRSAKLFPILLLLERVFLAPVIKVTFDRIEMTDDEEAVYAIGCGM